MRQRRRFSAARERSGSHKLAALDTINVTPLLDMCFCLLIIFMIATPVMEQTTQIDLPIASKTVASTPVEKKVLVIALDKDGRQIFNGREITDAALRAALRSIAQQPKDTQPVIRIRADGSLTNQRTWDLFSLVKDSGVSSVSVDTEVKN
jgi:biopolymer transport protein ExbD